MSRRLAPHDQRQMDETFAGIQALRATLGPLVIRAIVYMLTLGVCTGAEYFSIFSVVNNAIGPIGGEAPSAAPAVISFAGLICVAAFALHKRKSETTLPARLLELLIPYVAVAFALVMGIELAHLFNQNMNSGAVLDLSGTGAAAEPPLLERFFAFMSGPFALMFGLTTLASLYLSEAALSRLRKCLGELHTRRNALREAGALKAEIDRCERELGMLDVKRLEILRGLQPAATVQYANELAVAVADALQPFDAFILSHQIRRKKPASIIGNGDESDTDIDVAKLAQCIAPLKLDAKSILAAIK